MKKLFALATAALLSVASFDTFAQSTGYIGGNVGVWHDETADATSAAIAPEFGINLNNRWAIGTTIGYAYVGSEGAHNNSFVFAPYARFTYFRTGIVSLFVDGGFDMAFGRTSYKGDKSDGSAYCGIGFKPGIAINLNDRFSLVAKLGEFGFHLANDAAEDAGMHKGYGLDLYNRVNFSFYYNF